MLLQATLAKMVWVVEVSANQPVALAVTVILFKRSYLNSSCCTQLVANTI